MARNTAVRTLLIFGLVLLSAGMMSAQQTFNTTIYFDYTNYLSKGGPVTSAAKNNFFAFRRAYFTYENKINDNLKFRFRYDADNTAMTYKLDGYFEMIRNLIIGAEYFLYKNDKYLTNDEVRYDVSGLSLFGRCFLKADVISLFARFDRYEPNSKTSDDEMSLVIAGLDWAPVHKSMRLQPNVWIRSYPDSEKKNDVVFNFTFFLSF